MADYLAQVRDAVVQGAALAEQFMVCTAKFYLDGNPVPVFIQIGRCKIPRPAAFDAGNQTEWSTKRSIVWSMPTRPEGVDATTVPEVIRKGLIVQIEGADDPSINNVNFTVESELTGTFAATREILLSTEVMATPEDQLMADLDQEGVASYAVEVTGIQRSKEQLAKLGSLISEMRKGTYGNVSVTVAGATGDSNVFASEIDALEGKILGVTEKTMLQGMDLGKSLQTTALRAAITPTGENRRGNGPGRDKTGAMIKALIRNVEIFRGAAFTRITGFHGWPDGSAAYFDYQEEGTRGRGGSGPEAGGNVPGGLSRKRQGKRSSKNIGVPAANSLGIAIVPVREFLKSGLAALKR